MGLNTLGLKEGTVVSAVISYWLREGTWGPCHRKKGHANLEMIYEHENMGFYSVFKKKVLNKILDEDHYSFRCIEVHEVTSG